MQRQQRDVMVHDVDALNAQLKQLSKVMFARMAVLLLVMMRWCMTDALSAAAMIVQHNIRCRAIPCTCRQQQLLCLSRAA
jgi:hypothetical protein